MADTLFDRERNEARRSRLRRLGWVPCPGRPGVWLDPRGSVHGEQAAFSWLDAQEKETRRDADA